MNVYSAYVNDPQLEVCHLEIEAACATSVCNLPRRPGQMVTVQKLIEKNNRDIALFRGYVSRLTGLRGTRQAIGDFRHRITMAEKSNAILRANLAI